MTFQMYPNQEATYHIVVVKTGEVVGKFRLRGGASNALQELNKTIREDLEVRKVK